MAGGTFVLMHAYTRHSESKDAMRSIKRALTSAGKGKSHRAGQMREGACRVTANSRLLSVQSATGRLYASNGGEPIYKQKGKGGTLESVCVCRVQASHTSSRVRVQGARVA